jgi:1,4-dihydroxy-2-naphthoate polyprenyltransferase
VSDHLVSEQNLSQKPESTEGPGGRAATSEAMGWRAWVLALRPKTLTAALVPVVAATALVKFEGHAVLWWISIFALLSATFIQIGTNLVNDALDFKKGADTEKRIGPQRVTQSGLLTHKQVMIGGMFCFVVAGLLGVPLVIQGGWPIVGIGLVSLFLGYAYTGGPFPLAYKGLGDLFVILFFGIIAVMGTHYLHTHTWSVSALVAGVQIGCLATVLIAINNMRDAPQDALVGKKTLAVRFGLTFARIEIMLLILIPYFLGYYWVYRNAFWVTVFPVVAFPLARRIVSGVNQNSPGPIYNRYLALAAGLHLSFGLLMSVALWLR